VARGRSMQARPERVRVSRRAPSLQRTRRRDARSVLPRANRSRPPLVPLSPPSPRRLSSRGCELDARLRRPPRLISRPSRERRALLRPEVPSTARCRAARACRSTTEPRDLRRWPSAHVMRIAGLRRTAFLSPRADRALARMGEAAEVSPLPPTSCFARAFDLRDAEGALLRAEDALPISANRRCTGTDRGEAEPRPRA